MYPTKPNQCWKKNNTEKDEKVILFAFLLQTKRNVQLSTPIPFGRDTRPRRRGKKAIERRGKLCERKTYNNIFSIFVYIINIY